MIRGRLEGMEGTEETMAKEETCRMAIGEGGSTRRRTIIYKCMLYPPAESLSQVGRYKTSRTREKEVKGGRKVELDRQKVSALHR